MNNGKITKHLGRKSSPKQIEQRKLWTDLGQVTGLHTWLDSVVRTLRHKGYNTLELELFSKGIAIECSKLEAQIREDMKEL